MGVHPIAELQEYIAACVKRALRGQMPAALREYSFSFDEAAKRVVLKAEVERDLTDDEREQLSVAETELYADSIFGDDTEIKTIIDVVPKGAPLYPLPGGTTFLRDGDHATQAA